MTKTDDIAATVTTLVARARASQPVANRESAKLLTLAPSSELTLWGVPRMHVRNLPGRENEAAATEVDAWDHRERTCLVLSGAGGVGKSHAAARWLWREYPVNPERRVQQRRWWDAREIQMLGRFDRASHRELVEMPLLVVDDLGAEPGDEDAWWRSRVELLIAQRVEDLRGTLVTTNLDAGQLRARYGERLYDRLRHRARWVEVAGVNLRIDR